MDQLSSLTLEKIGDTIIAFKLVLKNGTIIRCWVHNGEVFNFEDLTNKFSDKKNIKE